MALRRTKCGACAPVTPHNQSAPSCLTDGRLYIVEAWNAVTRTKLDFLPHGGLCWQSQRSLKEGKYLGRIFLPKTTAKGAGTGLCHACMEEGEGGGGGGGGTV